MRPSIKAAWRPCVLVACFFLFAVTPLAAQSADLQITGVSDSPDPITLGLGNVTYTVSFTNAGPNSANNISLTNIIPSSSTFVSASATVGGSCSESLGTVTCTWASMSQAQNFSASIVVTPTASGTLTDSASVTATTADPNTGNNSGSQSTTVNGSIDLGITSHTDTPDPITLGLGNVSYFVTITNLSTSAASNPVLTDTIPSGSTFVSASANLGGTCSQSAGVVTCNWSSISASQNFTTTIVITPTAGGTITNSASVSADQPDPSSANNSSTQSTTVNANIDLGITSHTDTPDPITLGLGNVSYFVTITNLSTSAASNPVLTDTIPSGTTFVSASANLGGTCSQSAGVVTCNWSSISASQNFTTTIVITPTAGGTITNSASVSADQPDPNSANNSSTQSTTVNANIDLGITSHTDTPDPITLGLGNVSYFVTITNLSTSGASNPVLTDTIPSGTTFVSASANLGGTCSQSAGVVTCNWSSISASQNFTTTIVITPTAGGTITNSASVSADQPDPNAANNSSTQSTTVNANIDLGITSHTDTPDPITLGLGNVSYFVTITNLSTSGASNPVLTDTIPSGTTFVSASANLGGTCSQSVGVVTCNWSSISASQNFTTTIVITPTAGGTITNSASVSADQPDANTANNSSTQSTTVNASIDLAITSHTDSPDPITQGAGNISYFVTYSNLSTSGASNVVLTDTIPAASTYVSSSANAGGTCSQSAGIVTCNWASISAGQSPTTTIVVTPTAAGTLTNSATVSATQPDPNNANNTSTQSTTVNAACATVPSGVVSWYRAESNANDGIGPNDGTLNGGATTAVGKVGSAFSFNGTSAYVSAADDTSLRPSSLTIEGWFSFASTGSTQALVSKTVGTGTSDSFILWVASGTLNAAIGDSGGVSIVSGTFSPSTNTFYHLAFTFNGGTKFATLYVNGSSIASATLTKNATYDTHPLLIGAEYENEALSFFLNGLADEVTIYNSVVSGANIAAIYNAGTFGKCYTAPSAPGFTSITPSSGSIAGGTSAVINGTSLDSVSKVRFDTTPATITGRTTTTLSVTTPAHSAGSAALELTNPGGVTTQPAAFTFSTAPEVTSFTPTSGPVGTAVTITGSNFTGATAVTFGGNSDPSFIVINDTTISAHATGSGAIAVTSANGVGTSAASFTVASPTSVSSITTGNWYTPSTWSGGAVPQTYDNVTISGGTTVHLDANATAGSLTLTGAIDTANTLTISNTFNWTSNASLTSTAIVMPLGTTTNINGTGSHLINGGSLTNYGAMTMTGPLTTRNGANVTNQSNGSIDIQGDFQLGWDGNGPVGTIANAGSIVKSSGSGTATLGNGASFPDSGPIQAQSGLLFINSAVTASGTPSFTATAPAILQFDGNGSTFPTGTTFGGAGQVRVSGNATYTGTINASAAPFVLTNNTHTFTAATILGTLEVDNAVLTGALTIDASASMTIKTAGTHLFNGLALTNNGLLDVIAASISTRNGTTIANNGAINLEGDFNIGWDGNGGTGSITNAGTVTKVSGASLSTIGNSTPVSGGGTWHSQTGTLRFSGVTTTSATTIFNADASSQIEFTTSGNTFATGTAFNGNGAYRVAADSTFQTALLTFNGGLTLDGGTLTFNGVSVTGTTTWNNAAISGSGLTIPSGSTLTVANSGGTHLMNGGVISNSGNVNCSATCISSRNGSSFTNGATGSVNVAGDFFFGWDGNGGIGSIVNNGAMTKSAGTGTFTYGNSAALSGSGVYHVQSGLFQFSSAVSTTGTTTFNADAGTTFKFSGNGSTFATGTAFNGTGTYDFFANSTFSSNTITVAGSFILDGGTHTFNGVTVSGPLTWNNAVLSGSGLTISNGSTLTLNAGGTHLMDGGAITNNGTIACSGANIATRNGSTIANQGGASINIGVDALFGWDGNGALGSITNAGTITKTAGSGTASFGNNTPISNTNAINVNSGTLNVSGTITNSGTGSFNVADGATINFSAGGNSFASGTSFTGSGTNSGNANIANASTFTGTITSAIPFNINGGTVSWSAATLTAAVTWNNGTISGSLNLPASSSMNVANGGSHTLDGCAIDSFAPWTIHAAIGQRNGGSFTNETGVVFDIAGDFSFGWDGNGIQPPFSNAGTVKKSAGSGSILFGNGGTIINNDLIRVMSGSMQINSALTSGGTLQADSGTTITLTSGANNFLNGAMLNGGGTINVNAGSTWNGSLVITAPTTVTMNGGTQSFQSSVLSGALNWSTGSFTGTGLTIPAGSSLTTTASCCTTLDNGVIGNFATLTLNQSIFTRNGGTLTNNTGALLDAKGDVGVRWDGNGGFPTIILNGTVRKSAGNSIGLWGCGNACVINELLDVQSGVAKFGSGLTVSSGATVQVAIAGTTAATQYAYVDVSGTATLAGTFIANVVNPFIPPNGSTYQVMTFGTSPSDFGTKSLSYPSGSFNYAKNATNITLTANTVTADLAVATSASALNVTPSSTFTYGINTTNVSAQAATSVSMHAAVSAGATITGVSFTGIMTCTHTTTTIDCSAASFGTSDASSVFADVTAPSTTGTTSLTATLTSANDSNASNDASTTNVNVVNTVSTITVTSNADSGANTLRQAILDARNGVCGPTCTINFALPGSTTIALASEFPVVNVPVILDGTTQPGWSGTPLIDLNGLAAGTGATGFYISGGNSTVRGFIFRNFDGAGIELNTNGGDTITGNWFGLAADGVTIKANHHVDLFLNNVSNNTIGGTTAALRNVISGSSTSGVGIEGGGFNVVMGNYIGTDATGALSRGNTFNGVYITDSSNNTIGGTSTNRRNVISANGSPNVLIGGSLSTNNLVQNNYIGTNAAGTSALLNGSTGVTIYDAAHGNTIGSAGAGNLVSGNNGDGILMFDAGTSSNLVQANVAGLNAAGNAAIPNGFSGIAITGGAASNSIIGNVASGNATHGIAVLGSGTDFNIVQGNMVGVDAAGTTAIGNGWQGIAVFSGAKNNTIGGTLASQRNVVGANGINGIVLADGGTTNNMVTGNYSGTNAAGNAAIANHDAGIAIFNGAANNNVTGNLFSGNTTFGVYLTDPGTANNSILGNFIGVDAANTTSLANTNEGVRIDAGANHNTIGNASTGNVIAYNQYGVTLTTSAGSANTIVGNSIHNQTIGIDLKIDGVSANDAGDADSGPNGMQNSPALTNARVVGTDLLVDALVNSTSAPGTQAFIIDVYKADASLVPQGTQYLGSSGCINTNLLNATITIPNVTGLAVGNNIVATATSYTSACTSVNDGTSEFSSTASIVSVSGASADLALTAGVTPGSAAIGGTLTYGAHVVNNGSSTATGVTITMTLPSNVTPTGTTTATQGSCSVVASTATCNIGTLANGASADVSVVTTGNTGGSATATSSASANESDPNTANNTNVTATALVTGSTTLTVTSNANSGAGTLRQAISDAINGGCTAPCTIAFALPGSPTIALNSALPAITVPIVIDGTTQPGYSGTPLVTIDGTLDTSNGAGVVLNGASGTVKGLAITGFHSDGIQLLNGASGAILQNVISGNTASGIYLAHQNTAPLISIKGNRIGVNAAATATIGNGGAGIYVDDGVTNAIIGGTTLADANVIGGNAQGIRNAGAGSPLVVTGNFIGTNATQTIALPNGLGIQLESFTGANIVGGANAGEPNVIANNTGDGINVYSTSNQLIDNSIYNNGGLGIHLQPNANNNQGAPSLASAVISSGNLVIVHNESASATTQSMRVDFYKADPLGQGKTFLFTNCIAGNNASSSSTTSASAVGVNPGDNIVALATAIDGAGCTLSAYGDGTSQFSNVVTIGCTPPSSTINAPASACPNATGLGANIVSPTAGATYTWGITNGTITSGQGTTSITFSVGASGNAQLSVAVVNGSCSANGNAAVNITPSATPIVTANGPTTFCAGGSVILSTASTGSYQWFNGATPIATTQSINVTTSGSYSVTVTNGSCSATSAPTSVTVNPSPAPVITPSGPTTFCGGGSVTLDAGSGFTTYSWSTGANTQTINVTASGNYTVTVTGANGCTGAASKTVTVNANPTVTITGPSSTCPGGSVTLDAGAGFATYSWSNGATTQSITVTPASTATFSVNVTTAAGCTGNASKTVTVAASTTPTISAPANVCANASANASVASQPGASYAWSITNGTINSGQGTNAIAFTAGASGNVGLSINVTNACSGSASTSVPINPAPQAAITAPQNVNANSTGNAASVASQPGATYAWTISGGTISGGQGTNAITFTAGNTSTVVLNVTVTSNGCASTGTASISIGNNADLAISMSAQPGAVDGGAAVAFILTITNNGPNVAQGVVVNDTLPAQATFNSAGGIGWNCSQSASSVVCNMPVIAANATSSITINVTAPLTSATLTNLASVGSNVSDPNSSNNSASATATVTQTSCSTTAPSLIAPANNAANVASPVPFSWQAVPNATGYELWLAVDDAAPSIVANTTTTSATINVAGSNATWYVGAKFANNCSTNYSASRSFTLAKAANCDGHGVVTLVAPSANATLTSPIAFAWTSTAQAIGYRVWISIDGGAAQDVGTTDGATTLTATIPSGAISWFVDALFAGCPPTHSATSSFTVPTPEPCANHNAVSLIAPANNATSQTSQIVFQWTSAANANGYRLYASIDNGDFINLGTTTNTTLTRTIASGHVVWYVETLFEGCSSIESARRAFDIPKAQNCGTQVATLIAPDENSTTTNGNVTFSWTSVPNATSYEVMVSLNGASPSLLGTTTATSLTKDVPSGTLEWFVRTNVDRCDPRDSVKGHFTFTLPAACTDARPVLIAPLESSTTFAPVNLTWKEVAGATSYRVRVSVNGGAFATFAQTPQAHLDDANIPTGAIDWIVDALFSNNCPQTSSSPSHFTVLAKPPGCIAPTAPAIFGATSVSSGVPYTVRWQKVAGGTSYLLQESQNGSFSDASSQTTTDDNADFGHANSGNDPITFYYRVRALSNCTTQPGPYSPVLAVIILPSKPAGTSLTGVLPSDQDENILYTIPLAASLAGSSFVATANEPFLTVTPSSGVIPIGGTSLNVTANTTGLPLGTTLGGVTVTITAPTASSNRAAAKVTTTTTTTVSVSLVTPVQPKPNTAPPPDALIIPAVAHADGINSKFQSDVRITNTASQTQKYSVTFTPTGDNGAKDAKQTTIDVDAGKTVALDDLLGTWFSSGAFKGQIGTLELRPLTQLSGATVSGNVLANLATFASSRTFNATSNGTFGQYIPAIPFGNFIGNTSSVLSLQQIAQSQAFRTNVGLVEGSGNPAAVLISVFGGDGKKINEFPMTLTAGQHTQFNLAQQGVNVSDGRVEVKVTSPAGRVTAYASVLDNLTNDPMLVSPVTISQSGATKFVIPGVADISNGLANWRSDTRIYNPSSKTVNATLRFYSQAGGDPKIAQITLAPNEVKQLDNTLASVFGVMNDGGALHITTTESSNLITSARTYNQTTTGTYGQFINGVTPNDAAGLGGRAIQVLQIEESDRYRSNIGIAEVNGKAATVELSLVPADGRVTGKLSFDLAPNEFRQFNLRSFGVGTTYNGRVSVRVTGGDGRITAYASVIDAVTQDPTYIPAQ